MESPTAANTASSYSNTASSYSNTASSTAANTASSYSNTASSTAANTASSYSNTASSTKVTCAGNFCPYVYTKEILTWKNPTKTGIVLGSIDFLLIVIFGLFNVSILSLFAIVGLLSMGAGFVFSMLLGHRDTRTEFLTKDALESHMVSLYDVINKLGCEVRDIIFWTDHMNSLAVVSFLLVLTFVASWLSFYSIFFLCFNAVFLSRQLGEVYEKYLAPHMAKLMALLQTYISKIPKMTSGDHVKTN